MFELRWPSDYSFRFGSCKLGLISSRVKPMTLKSVFTASVLDAQHERDNVENKPASLAYLCRWERHLTGLPHLDVVDRWLATPKRARYSALIAFL